LGKGTSPAKVRGQSLEKGGQDPKLVLVEKEKGVGGSELITRNRGAYVHFVEAGGWLLHTQKRGRTSGGKKKKVVCAGSKREKGAVADKEARGETARSNR